MKIRYFLLTMALVILVSSFAFNTTVNAGTYLQTGTTAELKTWTVFEGTYSVPISANCQTRYNEQYDRYYVAGNYEYHFDRHSVFSYVESWDYFSDLIIEISSDLYYRNSSGQLLKTGTIYLTTDPIYATGDVWQDKSSTSYIGVTTVGGVVCESNTAWRVPDAYKPVSTYHYTACYVNAY